MDIVLDQVSKGYGKNAVLSRFSCCIPEYSRCALLAPSGAGKTTLLRLILGLETPDEGTITGVPEKTSALFQEDRLFPALSALTNLRMTVPEAGAQGTALLNALGLSGQTLTQSVATLSGGQSRRVALARALLRRGELLVLDEPFTGLDESARLQAARCICDWTGRRTLLLVTHRPEDLPLLHITQTINLP